MIPRLFKTVPLLVALSLVSCREQGYLTKTCYWDNQNIQVDLKWSSTSAQTGRDERVDRTLCIATAHVANRYQDKGIEIHALVLILLNKHEMELHSHSESLGLKIQPGESADVQMRFWIPSGLAHDAKSLTAKLSHTIVP